MSKILIYYHTVGIKLAHKINRKKRILFYTPSFTFGCGGIVAIFNMAFTINTLSDEFYTEIVTVNNERAINPIYNSYLNLYTLNDNDIVVYPEIVTGNPLNIKNVVRWILLELGVEMPLDHDKTFGPNDVIYDWVSLNNPKILRKSYINNIYKNEHRFRIKTCYLRHKYELYHGKIQFYHPPDSIEVDSGNHETNNLLFNESKFFYCYDPKTFFIIYSLICGCVPIVYPFKDKTKQEFADEFLFGNTDGISYGDSNDEKEFALSTLEKGRENILNMLQRDENTVLSFLNELKSLF
jgi:hypothetical protein